jgi:hypothetical protein
MPTIRRYNKWIGVIECGRSLLQVLEDIACPCEIRIVKLGRREGRHIVLTGVIGLDLVQIFDISVVNSLLRCGCKG